MIKQFLKKSYLMCLAVFPLIVSQILVGIPVKLCASTVSALTHPAKFWLHFVCRWCFSNILPFLCGQCRRGVSDYKSDMFTFFWNNSFSKPQYSQAGLRHFPKSCMLSGHKHDCLTYTIYYEGEVIISKHLVSTWEELELKRIASR